MLNLPKRKNPIFFTKSDFIILSHIGEGSFSQVYKIQKKNTSEIFALKIMNLENLSKNNLENIENEIKIQKNLKNENITKLIDFFESEKKVYLILEFCENGNLFDFIKKKKKKFK